MITKTHKLFWLILGVIGSCSLQAQEKNMEQIEKETYEYLEYMQILDNSQNTQAKGSKSRIIPQPAGLDPTVSFEGVMGNKKSWELYHKTMGNLSAKENDTPKPPLILEENEKPKAQANDITKDAELIPDLFGTANNQTRRIKIEGALGAKQLLSEPTVFKEETEDNHSFSRANAINIDTEETIRISGNIKNVVKNEELSGDIDIYELDIKARNQYILKIGNTSDEPFRFLAALYEGDDNKLLDFFIFDNTQDILYNSNNFTGSLKIAILSSTSFDRFDLSNPEKVFPLGGETSYEVLIKEQPTVSDRDLYKVNLKKGDVFGVVATTSFPMNIGLFGIESGSFVAINGQYSIRNGEHNFLPTEGEMGFHYVIPEDGEHLVFVRNGIGPYKMELGVSKPGIEENKEFSEQIIFLNMAGASLSLKDFFEGNSNDEDIRNLSSLKSFMPNWELDSLRDLNKLAFKIEENLVKKIKSELVEAGINPNLKVTVLSDYGDASRRDRLLDLLNNSNKPYSRLIIGGTRKEFGRRTVGLSSAIDIGNFDLTDNAIVLLDLLSETDTSTRLSINNIAIADGASKLDLIAEVVGNIAAHEAGHFLGNWHSDNTSDVLCIMDQGGGPIERLAGVLEGDAYGDPENIEISFVQDEYSSLENILTGTNETATNTAFGLTSIPNQARKQKDNWATFMKKLDNLTNITASPSISSYPNPQRATETSKLTINLEADSFLKLSLFDLQGRKIADLFTGEIKAAQPLELAIDPTKYNLKSGAYLYKITSNTGQKNHKLIIN